MNKHLNKGILIVALTVTCYFALYFFWTPESVEDAAALQTQLPVVIIDAGHGGEDGGTTSVSGVMEKFLNMEISQRLEQMLAFCGVETIMVRETDISVYSGNCSTLSEKKASDLKNRAELINRTPNAVVISIHQNHYHEARYRGAQVFYAPTDGSKLLAATVQDVLRTNLDPANRRQIEAADTVYLMNHIRCTGILLECGFLSNPQEDLLLQDPNYQIKLVSTVSGALLQYLSEGKSGI